MELLPEQRWRSGAGRHLPFALVLGVVGLGLLRIVQYHWRQGAVLIGLALLIAALLRVLVTDEQAGLIAIRSRSVDALLYSGLGFSVIVVAMTIIGGPLDR
ncbi:putative membrane protein [Saccharothrix ecbatanensis]|uniref:Putative membrane protein n=1 Tax=Saccharothrix ecbatanensis TaxID=1105145 RepID=A0A7W9HPI9_9PSEU|nr:putative membrane protein [Saccharothrix ecbatanensis]